MRTISTAVMLLAATLGATATALAGEDLRDVRLRVQNLTRPSGMQAAALTARLAPSAASRTVTATVQVGGSTFTLHGKIGRTGRVHLIGRRLDLAAALAGFEQIAVELSGGSTASIRFAAEGCAPALRGRRLECRESAGTGVLVDGAYDLTIASSVPSTTTEVARLTSGVDGTRRLTLYESTLDSATLTMASDFGLTGHFIQGGDAFIAVAGEAQDESTAQLSRLSGAVDATSPLPFHVGFVMERPRDGTASTLGGAWTLRVQGFGSTPLDGVMTLALTVGADGTAASAPTTIDGTNGGSLYTLPAGTCYVAPSGGLHCELTIDPQAGAFVIRLHGGLDAAQGSGQGHFAIGLPPVLSTQGSWAATRSAP